MKNLVFGFCLWMAFFVLPSVSSEAADAYKPKICVVNLMDSVVYYKSDGAKTRKVKGLFNVRQFAGEKLSESLTPNYSVEFLSMPASILSPNRTVFASLWGLREGVINWLNRHSDRCDFFLILQSERMIDPVSDRLFRSSGVVARYVSGKQVAAVYSTLSLLLIQPVTNKSLFYQKSQLDDALAIDGYLFSNDETKMNSDMISLVEAYLKRLVEKKIKIAVREFAPLI